MIEVTKKTVPHEYRNKYMRRATNIQNQKKSNEKAVNTKNK